MVKKKLTVSILCLIAAVILFSAAGLGLKAYYRNAFCYNTWINGVYCTGKSIEEVNKELEAGFSYEGITVTYGDEQSFFIDKNEVSYHADFGAALNNYLMEQNTASFFENLSGVNDRSLIPVVDIDENQLKSVLIQTDLYKEQEELKPNDVKMCLTEDGYILQDTTKGVLDFDQAMQCISDAFVLSKDSVDLAENNCFYDAKWSSKMQEEKLLFDKINAYQKANITYVFDDWIEKVDASVICNLLKHNDDGSIYLNEENDVEISQDAVNAYVDEMAFRHDTLGRERSFQTTKGDLITVSGGTYGNKMDADAEKKYLYNALLEKRVEEHLPIFSVLGKSIGKDDIGGTYIEVDMTDQMMYYYVDHELVLDTPIVTGNMRLGRETPTGVNYVYLKQRNRVLRGPGYASPVKFWMPVNKGIGIHDSSWRDEYGGDIYMTSGSHGCINTPLDKVEALYEMVDIGTPVIMFY